MRICYLIDDFSATGGIQRIVPMICSALCDYHEVHVVSMYDEHGDDNRDLYDERIKFSVLIEGKKDYIRQSFTIANLLKGYLADNGIEVLTASSEMLTPYCYLAVKGLDIPFLVWTHTPALSYDETFLQRPFKFLAAKKAARIIALTKNTKKIWKAKYKIDSVVAIPNPIDPKLMKRRRYASKSKKIVSVGRICYQKNYEKLVEVAKIVFDEIKDWSWDIYGDGEDRKTIEELLEENHLTERVHLKGNVSNMYDLYKEYGIQVMTSRFEGFPMTLLEGMANGLPMLGFDVNGVGEVIKDEVNGYIIPPFYADEMAEKIIKLIEDDELRKEFFKNNIKLRDDYSIDKAIDMWNKMYEEL